MSTLGKYEVKHVEGPEENRLAEAQQMSPEELLDVEKGLKRKLDTRLLACVWVIFVMNYLDRVCLPPLCGSCTSRTFTKRREM
jgi:hypothetical protein